MSKKYLVIAVLLCIFSGHEAAVEVPTPRRGVYALMCPRCFHIMAHKVVKSEYQFP